jgi:hypothetical protein
MYDDRVLSGMRPTGRMHIGHYHGALKNWVRLQEEYECLYFAADWHALPRTTVRSDRDTCGDVRRSSPPASTGPARRFGSRACRARGAPLLLGKSRRRLVERATCIEQRNWPIATSNYGFQLR